MGYVNPLFPHCVLAWATLLLWQWIPVNIRHAVFAIDRIVGVVSLYNRG